MERTSGKYGTAEGRWMGFGPYYAMFPNDFAKQVVWTMASPGGGVLDPFCGRGAAPFAAQAAGIHSLGIDSNPVAWVYSKVKTAPEKDPARLLRRLDEVLESVAADDRRPANEFQELAWSADALGFLNAARRVLDWRANRADRTLMGFVLAHLHGKRGESVSNRMMKSRAVGPDYAVRWWKERGLSPPKIDLREFFRKKIAWRYARGVIDPACEADIRLGDAESVLSRRRERAFSLLFTSPPYFNTTDYRQDNWMRLWALNEGPPRPDWKKDKRLSQKDLYGEMLREVFAKSRDCLASSAAVWVRTDNREFTKAATLDAMRSVWPNSDAFMRLDAPDKPTQTIQMRNKTSASGEVDILIPGNKPLPTPAAQWARAW